MITTTRNIFTNPTPLQVVLPTVVAGNLVYKTGQQKNSSQNTGVVTKNLAGWTVGSILTAASPISYLWTTSLATLIALGQTANKRTDEEKKETLINHASWWLSGAFGARVLDYLDKINDLGINGLVNNCINSMAESKEAGTASKVGQSIQNNLKKFKLNDLNLSKFYGFAIGAGILGPTIAAILKVIFTPNLAKKDIQTQPKSGFIDPIAPGYQASGKTDSNFNPIWQNSDNSPSRPSRVFDRVDDPMNIHTTFPWLTNPRSII